MGTALLLTVSLAVQVGHALERTDDIVAIALAGLPAVLLWLSAWAVETLTVGRAVRTAAARAVPVAASERGRTKPSGRTVTRTTPDAMPVVQTEQAPDVRPVLTPAEKRAAALALRAEDETLSLGAIAARVGSAKSTVADWLKSEEARTSSAA